MLMTCNYQVCIYNLIQQSNYWYWVLVSGECALLPNQQVLMIFLLFLCPSHLKYSHAICPSFIQPIRPLQVNIFDCSFADIFSYHLHNPHRRGDLLHLSRVPLRRPPLQIIPISISSTGSPSVTTTTPFTVWILFAISWGINKQYTLWKNATCAWRCQFSYLANASWVWITCFLISLLVLSTLCCGDGE